MSVRRYLSPFTSSVRVVALARSPRISTTFDETVPSLLFNSLERFLLVFHDMRNCYLKISAVGSLFHFNPAALIKAPMACLTPASYPKCDTIKKSTIFGRGLRTTNPCSSLNYTDLTSNIVSYYLSLLHLLENDFN